MRQHQRDRLLHLSRCSAVAEAVEGKRREKEGRDVSTPGPICTLMVGRLDGWMRVVARKEGLSIDPGQLNWAGDMPLAVHSVLKAVPAWGVRPAGAGSRRPSINCQ